jgi:hypothetical protein
LFGGGIGGLTGGFGIGMGFGLGLGALHSVFFAILWPIGVLGGSYLLCRTIYRMIINRQKKIIDRLTDKLKNYIENIIKDREK